MENLVKKFNSINLNNDENNNYNSKFKSVIDEEKQIIDLIEIINQPTELDIEKIFKVIDSKIIQNLFNNHIQVVWKQQLKLNEVQDSSSDILWNNKSLMLLKLLIDLFRKIADKFPLILLQFEDIFESIDEILVILDDEVINESFKSLKEKLRNDCFKNNFNQTQQPPPDDFRKLTLIPTLSEIKSSKNLYLRANLKSGTFLDVEHYLDVHFRLLREDYVGSLRDGIIEYLKSQRRNYQKTKFNLSKLTNIRVYQNVKINNYVTDDRNIVHELQLEITDHYRKIRWETSKRLIEGSLLCLTNDNFQTAYFAIVFDRNVDNLYDGNLLVKFDDWISVNNNFMLNNSNNNFIMVETLAYYESYHHTLQKLKSFNENNLPFSKHIVYCDNHSVDFPKYLRGHICNYDFRPLIKNNKNCIKKVKEIKGEFIEHMNLVIPDQVIKCYDFSDMNYSKINVEQYRLWPTASLLGLNESQYRAVRSALTRELVVIQGPPGTGKTYVGVEVIKMLLHNYDKINVKLEKNMLRNKKEDSAIQSPILVVAYTNHALDQLLMMVSKFLNEGVDEIIRIGGRSKEEALNGCNLRNIRSRYKYYREFPSDIYRNLSNKSNQLSYTIRSINRCINGLNDALKIVLNFSDLESFFTDQLTKSLFDDEVMRFYDATKLNKKIKDRVFMDWLGMGNLDESFNRDSIREAIMYMDGCFENQDNDDEFYNQDKFYEKYEGFSQYQPIFKSNTEEKSDANLNEDLKNKSTSQVIVQNELKTAAPIVGNAAEEAELINAQREVDEDIENKSKIRKLIGRNNQQRGFRAKGRENVNHSSLNFIWKQRSKFRNERKRQLNSKYNIMEDYEIGYIKDLWELSSDDRARFYRRLSRKYCESINKKLNILREQFNIDEAEYAKSKDLESYYMVQHAKIIGMTTTGAAKNQSLLQLVKPKIIIAEEAAEVFESHIITCLSESCEQLILIGDNEQLFPTPNLYELGKKFNLNVSLFERLVNNKIPKTRLNIQHRMRPEISFLMKYFYDDLVDSESVKHYDSINGMVNDVYFIDHEHQEKGDVDSFTKSNIYEAEYLTKLCDYLLKQNYKPEQITILVAYGGQLLTVKNTVRAKCSNVPTTHPDITNVRITPIDNYQGEENDIIILSLVRSNPYNSIGFLAVSNRICVALSRAKKGFYVMGNFQHLAKNSQLWSKIVTDATNRQIIGKTLSLKCQRHPDNVTIVNKTEDFDLCINGGCTETCNQQMACGHFCENKCHVIDHAYFNCYKPCERLLKGCSMNHKCKQLCYKECKTCMFKVKKILPKCGHEATVECSKDVNEVKCQHPVNTELPCGHLQNVRCHILQEFKRLNDLLDVTEDTKLQEEIEQNLLYYSTSIDFQCQSEVEKHFEKCNHVKKCKCHEAEKLTRCEEKVKQLMPNCGHIFELKCFEDPKLTSCKVQVDVKLVNCEHRALIDCSNNNLNFLMKYKCKNAVNAQLKCNHIAKIECHLRSDLDSVTCKEPCQSRLKCGHNCSNKCSDCKNNQHAECNLICNKTLICGHKCKLKCGVPCFICTEDYVVKCPHRELKKKCFEMYEPCKQPCEWSCKHQIFKCNKKCYEYCAPIKCNFKCDNLLPCKHKCQSLCGETCFCISCVQDKPLDASKVYIKLHDCKCIIEVNELDKHMILESYRLRNTKEYPKCPSCDSFIYYSKRYSSAIQQNKHNSTKLLHVFDNRSFKRCLYLTNQAANLPDVFQREMDLYMQNLISNVQISFLENRLRLLKLFIETKKLQKKLTERNYWIEDSIVTTSLNKLFKQFTESPIEIPNETGFRFASQLLLCYYYFAYLSSNNNNKGFLKKIEADIKSNRKHENCYFNDMFLKNQKLVWSINIKLFRLENVFKPIRSFYQLKN